MSDEGSFHGSTGASDPTGRRASVLVLVLAVAFIGIMIAKPWTAPVAPPTQSPRPSGGIMATAPPSASPTVTAAGETQPIVGPFPDAFVTPSPPPATAVWRGIRWRRLASNEPLTLIRSVLRWRGGFIALGYADSGGTAVTPVWASLDGAHWAGLPFNTSTTFWPGLLVVRVAEVPTGVVALTEGGGQIVAWTSRDGTSWLPHAMPLPPEPSPPSLAAGPAGLVATSGGQVARVATSPNGTDWQLLPSDTFPTGFLIADIRGTATGYVVAGEMVSETGGVAVTFWSADGRSWVATPLPLALLSGIVLADTGLPSTVDSLVAGRAGLIALGRVDETPGAALWWQSSDGRQWRLLGGYPPLGPTTCTGEGCGSNPDGALVGDGERMVALRGGPDARAWTSSDGLIWRPLRVEGDLPSEGATKAVITPGGVLLSDGSRTWFGEAMAP